LGKANAQDLTEDSIFIKRISDNILSSNDAYENLRYLTKNIGHRLAGSRAMVKSEQWGLQTMKKYYPAKVYFQQCMVPHWVRGGKDMAALTYIENGKKKTYALDMLALGNSLGSGDKGVTAPLIVVTSFKDLEEKKDLVKGKIVFYNIPFEDSFPDPFRAYGKNVTYRGSGASFAAKHGAVGMLMRSMTNGTNNYPHTGSLRYNDSFPKIPAAAIGLYDVAKINELNAKGIRLTAKLVTHGKILPDTIGNNVIAEMTGSEFPGEYITIGGHLDSWDVGEGAHDDGAGIVQTIEVLRAFAALGYQPKRSIRFVLFANEENGLRGGNKYADEAKAKNEQHIFALESDAGGFAPRGFSMTASDTVWQKIAPWKKLFLPYFGHNWERGGGGADIGPLNRAFRTPVAGLDPDPQRYFDVHHARSDVFESVNIRELKLGAVNMAALIYLVDKYGL
jgi:hypothetical protein